MAGARRALLLLLFLLFQMAALAPLDPDGGGGGGRAEGAEQPPKEGSVSKSHDSSSASKKPLESINSSPGAASSDPLPKSSQTESKESQKLTTKSKNIDQSTPNAHAQNQELSGHQESENLQDNAKPPQAGPHKSDPKKTESVPHVAGSNQLHTSELDSDAQKSSLNEAEQGGALSQKSVVSVPDSLSKKSDSKEVKDTHNLPPSTENSELAAAVPKSHLKEANQDGILSTKLDSSVIDSSSKKSDDKEGKQKEEKSNSPQPGASVPESSPENPDQNEGHQNENLPADSKTLNSDTSVVKSPPEKSDQNEGHQNENLPADSKTLNSDTPVVKSSEKSDQNEGHQNENMPADSKTHNSDTSVVQSPNENEKLPAENNPSDTSVPKDEEDEEDVLEDDEMIDDGKAGEEIAGASQSEKEEAKSSPTGPVPKNGSENSHFFAYLVTTAIVVAALYIAYHNKRKIIAFALEGKKSKVIRRPKSSDYQRLDQKI